MGTYNALKALAKSSKWQSLFILSKECSGIRLFKNQENFTEAQILFLNLLSFYNNAQNEIQMGNMPDWAFKKDIYIEAYNEFNRRESKKKNKREDVKGKKKDKGNPLKTGLKIYFE